MTAAGWDTSQVAMLKKLWEEGLSASQIAARLGNGATRNAVVGKIHRLRAHSEVKLAHPSTGGRPGTYEPRESKRERTGKWSEDAPVTLAKPVRSPRPRPVLLPPMPFRDIDLPDDGRITVLHLSDKTCRWPIGDPQGDGFCFCGHRPETAPPYCDYHTRVASNGFPTRSHRSAAVDRRWGG